MPEEVRFWFIPPIYYTLRGDIIVEIDDNFCVEIRPGTEYYYKTKQRLLKLQPIGYSEAVAVVESHCNYTKSLLIPKHQEVA